MPNLIRTVSTAMAASWITMMSGSGSAARFENAHPIWTASARRKATPGDVIHRPRELRTHPLVTHAAAPMSPVPMALMSGRPNPRSTACDKLATKDWCVNCPSLSQGERSTIVAARLNPRAPVAPATNPSRDSRAAEVASPARRESGRI